MLRQTAISLASAALVCISIFVCFTPTNAQQDAPVVVSSGVKKLSDNFPGDSRLAPELRTLFGLSGTKYIGVDKFGRLVRSFPDMKQATDQLKSSFKLFGYQADILQDVKIEEINSVIVHSNQGNDLILHELEKHELIVSYNSAKLGITTVIGKNGISSDFLERLLSINEVDYIQPNNIYHLFEDIAPNDPLFKAEKQWAYESTDINSLWSVKTESQPLIAVIDSGVNYGHGDLKLNIWSNTAELNGSEGVDDDNNGYVDDVWGYDFVGDRDGEPYDEHGHGTKVAGVLGAVGNNSMGGTGVSWRSNIMVVRVFDESATPVKEDVLVEAITYAVDNGARIIVASWGGPSITTGEALKKGLDYAEEHGVLVVAAAGNENKNIDEAAVFPASLKNENIITVMAGQQKFKDDGASFIEARETSNYGAESVDFAAPGANMVTTSADGGYTKFSGTSAAAPFVAGISALIWSIETYADYTPKEIKNLLVKESHASHHFKDKSVSNGFISMSFINAVEISGTLTAPTFSLGAEGTGILLKNIVTGTSIEVDFSALENMSEISMQGVRKYLEKNVKIQGKILPRTGDARGAYKVLEASSIEFNE